MAREIKFRGKDATGRKGWVYGDLVHNQRVTTTGLEPRVMVGGYEVVPETVGQFTGLYDRIGKEVYEGDIIAHADTPDACTHKIIWLEEEAAFGALWRRKGEFLPVRIDADWMLYKVVVGNIYGKDKED